MSTRRSAARVAVAHLVYDVLLTLGVLAALPFWLLRWSRDPHRARWLRQRLRGRLPGGIPGGRPVWIHAVSVGEVKAARALVAVLRARDPSLPLVVSTGTSTGFETATRAFPDTYVCHQPLDLAWVVRRFLRLIDPRLVILLELEAWPSLMRQADARGVPLVVLNGRITERSFRQYRRWNWWIPEFDRLSLVAAQDEDHAGRFVALGVPPDRVSVTGNLKHDLVGASERDADLGRELGLEVGPEGGPPVFVAGSTHPGEDEQVLGAWRRAPESRLVLVPRHPDRIPEVVRLMDRLGVPVMLRSEVSADRPVGTVLLVDTMGELEALFALSDVVFLGGSLVPVGGHNVLEPAAAGRPVLVGPHLHSCRREAERLRAAGGLQVVSDPDELARSLTSLLTDGARRAAMGEAALRAVTDLRGAAQADVDRLHRAGLLRLHGAPQ